MFTRFRAAVGLLAAVVVVGSFAPQAAAAPPMSKELEEILSWVPHDAAVFVHVDVSALWKSKQMDAVRKENPAGMFEKIDAIGGALGIPVENVTSFTLFIPKVKAQGDQAGVCAAIAISKPHNPKQVVTALAALAGLEKLPREFASDKFKKERENVYSIAEGRDGKEKTLFLFDNPNRVVILGPKGHDLMKPAAGVKKGPISEALAAVVDGKSLAFGLNFANLPDDIRTENVPPEVEPFKPIIHSDAVIATATFDPDLTLNVKVKCPTRAKALEAEKSMGVFKTLMQTVLAAGIAEVQKDEAFAKLVALGKQTQDILKAATIASDDAQAMATLKAKADFDVSPLVTQIFGKTGGAASRAVTVNNLKQLGLAMHIYHDTYNGLPAAAVIGKKGKPLLSWRVAILPYVEQNQLYKEFKLDEPWDSDHNKKVFEKNPMPKVFEVVGVTKEGVKNTHMQVFRGNGAIFDLVQSTKLGGITDGTSNTLMVVLGKTAVPWTKPDDIEFDAKTNPADQLLFLNDLAHVAFADGSVRSLKKSLPAETWRALITKAGGEVVNFD